MKKEHRFDRGPRALALPARSVLALALAGLMLCRARPRWPQAA